MTNLSPQIRAYGDAAPLFEALFESTHDAALFVDGGGKCIEANGNAAELLGLPRNEVVGSMLNELVGSWAASAIAESWRSTAAGAQRIQSIQIERRDGGARQVRATVRAEVAPGLNLCVLQDRTEQLREERGLHNLLAGTTVVGPGLFPALVTHLAAALGVKYAVITESLDPQHTKLRTLGFWADGELLDEIVYETAHTPCEHVVSREELCYFPDRVMERFPNDEFLGERKIVSYMGTPLAPSPGTVLGHLCIFHDAELPDEGRARTFLSLFAARAAAELDRVQTEQQLHTSQERLQQSQRMEAVGRLAGGIAHDFNNLLTIIRGYTDLTLNQLRPSDPLRGNLEGVVLASRRAAELTNKLLAFSRGRVVTTQSLDLNVVTREMGSMLERLIGDHISLTIETAPKEVWIEADTSLIEQVLINLVTNARDATRGGGSVTIETAAITLDVVAAALHPNLKPGHYVRLTVRDTGTGIEPADLPHIFEPFFTTKAAEKGTGLGLSTVYGIVSQSGGAIEVESRPGEGTVFSVYLRRSRSRPGVVPVASIASTDGVGWETILVVEDNPSVRHLAAAALTSAGFHVVEAGDGAEALDLFEKSGNHFHLIVSDILMPKMTGHELSARLAKTNPEVKMLLISGYAESSGDWPRPSSAGRWFLSKPFTPDALIRAVRDALDAPNSGAKESSSVGL